jgi:hypothetical protein
MPQSEVELIQSPMESRLPMSGLLVADVVSQKALFFHCFSLGDFRPQPIILDIEDAFWENAAFAADPPSRSAKARTISISFAIACVWLR